MLESRNKFSIISLIILGLLTGLFLFSTGCAPESNEEVVPKKAPTKLVEYQVGIVLSEKNLNNINQQVLLGVNKAAAKSTKIKTNIIKPKDFVDAEESIRYLAENSYNLIIAVGEEEGKVANNLAKEYDNILFAVTQVPSNNPNVIALNFNLEEGISLTGALAAALSVENQVAFIGQNNNQLTKAHQYAFVQGINDSNVSLNRQVKLLVRNIDNLKDIANLNTQLVSLIGNKVDYCLISSPEGSQVLYVLNKNMLKNLSESKPTQIGLPYASIVKKMDTAIYNLILKASDEKELLTGGDIYYGLQGGNIALQYTNPALVPPNVQSYIQTFTRKIQAGYLKLK